MGNHLDPRDPQYDESNEADRLQAEAERNSEVLRSTTPDPFARLKQYGELHFPNATIFKAPFDHLNKLSIVIESDFHTIKSQVDYRYVDALRIQRELDTLWTEIELSCEACGYDIFDTSKRFPSLQNTIAMFRQELARLDAAIKYLKRKDISNIASTRMEYLSEIPTLYEHDYRFILQRDQEYNASWLKRGGVGAFMMLARKWDRFVPMVTQFGYNPIRMLVHKPDRIDDVEDLRRYLFLVSAEWFRREQLRS